MGRELQANLGVGWVEVLLVELSAAGSMERVTRAAAAAVKAVVATAKVPKVVVAMAAWIHGRFATK